MNLIELLKILFFIVPLTSFDLTVDLYKHDIFNILSDDVLSYDSIEDNLKNVHSNLIKISKDSSISKITTY